MTLAQIVHFALAMALPTQAVLIMHRALPRVIDARGHWQGYCHLLLAFALILSFQPQLERALSGAELNGWALGRDSLLLLYAWCRYRYALRMNGTGWSATPE